MGCWSVSCGISNITIIAGNECVLLPLKKRKSHEYYEYQIATLPIYGEYNDYGGIENIVEDDNTKHIEEYFGVSIEEFCTFLVDGKFTYKRREAEEVAEKINHLDEISEWRFMWINKKVFETMCINNDTWHKGFHDFGTENMLKALGCTFVEKSDTLKNQNPKRYNQLWTKGDVQLYSDGRSLLIKNKYVYALGKNNKESLDTYINIPEELKKLQYLSKDEAWRYLSETQNNTMFFNIFSNYSEADSINFIRLCENIENDNNIKLNSKFYHHYLNNFETYADRIAVFHNLQYNLHVMSHQLLPHTLYLTPQCGEHVVHQKLLEAFCAINKEIVIEIGGEEV